jgi:hypothetical protein
LDIVELMSSLLVDFRKVVFKERWGRLRLSVCSDFLINMRDLNKESCELYG